MSVIVEPKSCHCKKCGAFIGSLGCSNLCPTCQRKEKYLTKEEVIAMLYKLKSEIDNMPKYFPYTDHTRWYIDGDVSRCIQKHIDNLKGEQL